MSAEPIAILRYSRGEPGKENEMPRVVSCDWLPDGEYEVFLSAPEPLLAEVRADWMPIETAPYSTPVEVKVGHMTLVAVLWPGVSEDDEGRSCDQWAAHYEGEYPPCWSEGACWESNEDEVMSLQPTAWRLLTRLDAARE